MMLLYNLLWPLGLLVFLPGFLLKMFRRGGYRKSFGQRLGFYSNEIRERLRDQHPVWMHAVSVGEVLIALKLARSLQNLRPDLRFVLTTTTTTGYPLAQKLAPESMTVLYTPLDFWPIMRRAFRLIAPSKIVLIEAEVWPNMVNEAARRNIPVVLANARLSQRSEGKFLRFRPVLAPIFRKLALLCVTEAADVQRWQRIGARDDRIHTTGNIKFDSEDMFAASNEPQLFLQRLGIDAARPVLLGGSTHRGEEQTLADAFVALRLEFPSLFLILAPRHVERANEIEALLLQRGLRVARRTADEQHTPDVLLINTTGELAHWYRVASVVFIGKSLTAHGGQNPVEAIAANKSVIIGPHMENFAALARQLESAGAVLCAHNPDELTQHASEILRDAHLRESMIARAREVIAPHRGATGRTAALINALG